MSIHHNQTTNEFHLENESISYIIHIAKGLYPSQLYFGRKIAHRDSFSHLLQRDTQIRAVTVNPHPDDTAFSLEHTRQEYPTWGKGDFREPAIELTLPDGATTTDFHFKSYAIHPGKSKIDGLPATYVEDQAEAETLELILEDAHAGCQLSLYYTIFAKRPVITRHSVIRNIGNETVRIRRAMSCSIDLPHSNFELLQLSGAWARERHVHQHSLSPGIRRIDSKRGASSHHHNPFIALASPDANEENGEVYGFSLVYSGSFMAQVEVDSFDVSRVMIGINPFDFQWKLSSKASFSTPETVMVYSRHGLQEMSHTYHSLYRERLARGKWRERDRPVLINNWEATYFDFDETKILNIATRASELGIELFVLDDGWFGKRNDDTTSLGDWTENREKLPAGISGLSRKIHERGMKFGLWFEPEMVSPKSRLFETRPEWAIQIEGRNRSEGRHQYILDFSREEVRNHIFDTICVILDQSEIDYIKWDMNRNMSEIGSGAHGPDRQQEIAHRYILGLYELLERLTTRYPDILFESCSAGGGRFDPGMLHYMPQTWTSDNSEAVERLKIQHGTSIVYPISSMGAHVSAVPNHQVGRSASFEFRGHVAMFGVFGYELDLSSLSTSEIEQAREQIAFYKRHRRLILNGKFHRLKSPFEGNETAWIIVAADQSEAIGAFYETLARPNPGFRELKLRGLNPNSAYAFSETGRHASGDELMNIGIKFSAGHTGTSIDHDDGHSENASDFSSMVFHLQSV